MKKTILKIQKSRFELSKKEVIKALSNYIEDTGHFNVIGDDTDFKINKDDLFIIETTIHISEEDQEKID